MSGDVPGLSPVVDTGPGGLLPGTCGMTSSVVPIVGGVGLLVAPVSSIVPVVGGVGLLVAPV